MKRSLRVSDRKNSKKKYLKILLKTTVVFVVFTILIIVLTPTPFYRDGFKNLKDLQKYANQTNEQTPIENKDTLRPEFTNYYKSQIPTFFQRIKNKIKLLLYLACIVEKPVWSVSFFKTLLENLAKTRETAGYKDNFIYKIYTDPNSKFIIFGNLQGAYHSLVRCLTKIKDLGIIDENLKINSSNNYMILMGDVVDRSPFTLETLTAVMRLMEVNPKHVIYLRGNHESKNYWQEHTLKTELQIRAAHLSNERIPLEKEINKFFNTLPLAVYLTVPNTTNDFVRVSDSGRTENELLTEANFAEFLTKQSKENLSHLILKKVSYPEVDTVINIKAIIRGEKKRKTFQKMEGLRLLAPDMDSVAWNILSCPTVVYQTALDFYNDAFVVLSASSRIKDWEITLYSHDVRTKDPFKETKYNFISGIDLESYKKQKPQIPKIQPPPIPTAPVPMVQVPTVPVKTVPVKTQITTTPQPIVQVTTQTLPQPQPQTQSTSTTQHITIHITIPPQQIQPQPTQQSQKSIQPTLFKEQKTDISIQQNQMQEENDQKETDQNNQAIKQIILTQPQEVISHTISQQEVSQ